MCLGLQWLQLRLQVGIGMQSFIMLFLLLQKYKRVFNLLSMGWIAQECWATESTLLCFGWRAVVCSCVKQQYSCYSYMTMAFYNLKQYILMPLLSMFTQFLENQRVYKIQRTGY